MGQLLGQSRSARFETLADGHQKGGEIILRAFAPVAEATRDSVVQFERGGERLALGTVIDGDGWILTKASEVMGEEFICRLPDGREVGASLVKVDEKNDIALVQVKATGLRPVEWAVVESMVGQWAVTPGITAIPEAVGILSASPRRIQHQRAMIGVVLDLESSEARVASLIEELGAERAGLVGGDVVVAVNETDVSNREGLVRALREFRAGQIVRLRIRRAEELVEVDVEMMVPRTDQLAGPVNRAERMNRMGSEVSARADGFDEVLMHDTVLQAWQCGGPLTDLDGKAMGLNIARAGRVASYALSARLVREITEPWRSELKAQ
jgi:serine protease Do